MPTVKRNWCAHPSHLQTLPDGTKVCTKVGPKPNHPLGSRRITSTLANYINKTCQVIVNDSTLELNENHSLCRKCFDEERARFVAAEIEQMETEDHQLDDNSDGAGVEEELEDSSALMKAKQDYAVEMLNEAFKLFRLEPVVP
jgi:hypothetical protein